MNDISDKTNETNTILNDKVLKFEKYKYNISLIKWVIGSVVLVVVALIIDNGFKERTAGIQEMQAFDKYVEVILKADNIEERWKLSEFFSTVTPTERLRLRWITYKNLISNDYETFKKLKQTEFELTEKIKEEKSPETVNKLRKIKKQLEPFEQKLSDPTISNNTKSATIDLPTTTNSNTESELKNFKEKLKKEASSDTRYKLDEYFKKANEINNAVVIDMIKELGDPYQNIQTGINYDYKEETFSNQYGVISKFDNSKKIWPLFQAKFSTNPAIFTLKEDGKTETFTSPLNDIKWDSVRQFIRAYFIKRLDRQLK